MSYTVGAATANHVWDVNRSVPQILGNLFWYVYAPGVTLCQGARNPDECNHDFNILEILAGKDR